MATVVDPSCQLCVIIFQHVCIFQFKALAALTGLPSAAAEAHQRPQRRNASLPDGRYQRQHGSPGLRRSGKIIPPTATAVAPYFFVCFSHFCLRRDFILAESRVNCDLTGGGGVTLVMAGEDENKSRQQEGSLTSLIQHTQIGFLMLLSCTSCKTTPFSPRAVMEGWKTSVSGCSL